MSGVYAEAQDLVAAAVGSAEARAQPTDALLKAMMREILKRYASSRRPGDILSEIEFELENLADDGEFPFSRP